MFFPRFNNPYDVSECSSLKSGDHIPSAFAGSSSSFFIMIAQLLRKRLKLRKIIFQFKLTILRLFLPGKQIKIESVGRHMTAGRYSNIILRIQIIPSAAIVHRLEPFPYKYCCAIRHPPFFPVLIAVSEQRIRSLHAAGIDFQYIQQILFHDSDHHERIGYFYQAFFQSIVISEFCNTAGVHCCTGGAAKIKRHPVRIPVIHRTVYSFS